MKRGAFFMGIMMQVVIAADIPEGGDIRESFSNALEWSPSVPSSLLLMCKEKIVNMEEFLRPRPQVVVLTYSANSHSSEDQKLQEILTEIRADCLSTKKEYIIAGYKKGAEKAIGAVRQVFDALADRKTKKDLKDDNNVKFIAFYPHYLEIGQEFCRNLQEDLNISNCLYFATARHRCPIVSPGVKIDITFSEYYRDNPERAGCAAMFVPIFIAWKLLSENSKRNLVTIAAIWPFIYNGLDMLLLQPGNLGSSSVETAYNYTQINYRKYINFDRIGEVPWFFSAKRGFGGWIYRGLTS